MTRKLLMALGVAGWLAGSAVAQTTGNQPGRVARSVVGEVGQRQTRDDAPNIDPMARLSTRVQNRVQNRIRNRIDPTYDPLANAAEPFTVAAAQARTSGRQD